MPRALVLWHGRRLALMFEPPQRPREVRMVGDLSALAAQILGERPLAPAPGDRAALDLLRATGAVTSVPSLKDQLSAEGVSVETVTLEVARDRSRPLRPSAEEREMALAVARAALAKAQRDPTETMIALAREEERLERSLGRERNSQESLLRGWGEANPDLAQALLRFGDAYSAHHATLERELEARVRALAPRLSSITGEKAAARLISAAGSLAALARMPAGRLQLLGARRRPIRGPRHGIIYRARGMDTVPWHRQGAFARSVAASAVIAARMDLIGETSGGERPLVERLERRRRQLTKER